jgi:hypothetical protein
MQWCKVKFKNVVFSYAKKVVFFGRSLEVRRVFFNGIDDGVTILVRKNDKN